MTDTQAKPIRIGTRRSALALKQAELVRDAIIQAHPAYGSPDMIFIVPMNTSGDRMAEANLAEIGGKGLFTKEIEEALLNEAVDIAVHSMKDMPTFLPEGLMIAAMLEREDPRDVFVSHQYASLAQMPGGATLGTSSIRRSAQIKMLRTDITIVPFRGNVTTRLKKMEDGFASATILAIAGLKRLHLESAATQIMTIDDMLPAVAQGAIGIECRVNDSATRTLLAGIDHAPTSVAVGSERAMLAILDGSCRTPIGGYAELTGENKLYLRGMVIAPDGGDSRRGERIGHPDDAATMGADLGEELKQSNLL